MAKRLIFLAVFVSIAFSSVYSQFQKFEYGIISWFGDDYEGKKTASGEIYDGQKMTAAHRIFPFGSVIVVENLENGRKVTLTVNDRGPYTGNNILEVSKKAADDLGFLKKGTVYARITLLKLGDNKVVDIVQPPVTNVSSASSSSSSASISSSANLAINPNATLPGALPLPGQGTLSTASNAGNQKYQIVVTTNIVEVFSTNQLILTNYVAVPITNILNIEPYEEKIIENDLTASNTNAFTPGAGLPKNTDEFVMDESSLKTPVPALDNSGSNAVYTEKEVNPDTILSNEALIKPEMNTNRLNVIVEKSNPEENGNSYIVQAGAFTSESAALKLYDILKKKNYEVFTTENIVKGKKWIRIKIGYYGSITEARSVSDELKKLGINALVLKGKK